MSGTPQEAATTATTANAVAPSLIRPISSLNMVM
jgi:hypothetical protein